MIEKVCYILRGIPGSGKSTIARHLTEDAGVRFETDDYFYNSNGEYEWKPENVELNHLKCFEDFCNAVKDEISPIVQSNTNTQGWQWNKYADFAKEHGYIVHVMVVENYHSGESIHNVPDDTVNSMEKRLRNDIKLK